VKSIPGSDLVIMDAERPVGRPSCENGSPRRSSAFRHVEDVGRTLFCVVRIRGESLDGSGCLAGSGCLDGSGGRGAGTCLDGSGCRGGSRVSNKVIVC
jgi:hypothetical protein